MEIKKKWGTEGITMLADILRMESDNLIDDHPRTRKQMQNIADILEDIQNEINNLPEVE